MSAPVRARTSVREFARVLQRRRPGALLRSFLLLIATSATEGVGLLLLVPMLNLVGVNLGGGALGGISRILGDMLRAVGLPATLPVVLGMTVAVVGLRAMLQQWESLATTRLAATFARDVRDDLFRRLLAMPWPRYVRWRNADLVNALTSHCDQIEYAVRLLVRLAADVVATAVAVAIALRVSWRVTLMVALAGAVLLLALRTVRASGREQGQRLIARWEWLFRVASELITGMKAVRGYGLERRAEEVFAQAGADYAAATTHADRLRARESFALAAGTIVLLSLMVYGAVAMLRLPPAAILILLAIYSRLMPRLAATQLGWHQLNEALAAWDAVQGFMAGSESTIRASAPTTAAVASGPPAIAFEVVNFRYDGAARDAVREASFEIPAGRVTALVGRSGAGKSTIADLLLGLLHPSAGTIRIDGRPLDDVARERWRAGIGLVTQDVILFPGTIRENLMFIAPQATPAEIDAALEAAGADFVRGLPGGLDTVVGDRARLFSGGERQRIALARALLRRPPLLVLDEATSALDAGHERQVLQALRALTPGVTIVLVSHRLSVVRETDHVIAIEDGAVAGEGPWGALAERSPELRELFAL